MDIAFSKNRYQICVFKISKLIFISFTLQTAKIIMVQTMYILASVFFEKTINTYLKLKFCVACREFVH